MIKLKTILNKVLKETEEEDFNVAVGPWDNFTSEYQALEDKFGIEIASELRNTVKDYFSSPEKLLNKGSVYIETLLDQLSYGQDFKMANMYAQDQQDINDGLSQAAVILMNNKLTYKNGDDLWNTVDKLWEMLDSDIRSIDTQPRDHLYGEIYNLVREYIEDEGHKIIDGKIVTETLKDYTDEIKTILNNKVNITQKDKLTDNDVSEIINLVYTYLKKWYDENLDRNSDGLNQVKNHVKQFLNQKGFKRTFGKNWTKQ